MKNLILLVTIFLTSEIFAQSTLIEYNFHDETYVFYKITRNGKKVETKKPFGYTGEFAKEFRYKYESRILKRKENWVVKPEALN